MPRRKVASGAFPPPRRQDWSRAGNQEEVLRLVKRVRLPLLGVAAHPMYPTGCNGSAQTILDAQCLEKLLPELAPEAALKACEAERLPKAAAVVRSNRLGGPECVIEMVAEACRAALLAWTCSRSEIIRGWKDLPTRSMDFTTRPVVYIRNLCALR
jgi:2-polyprenyl-6-methoxyphenol hydroxylase-like FAD-dependent oxidoreductase